jgi:D-beta-D-heptose 7-phosphate kinase/D-beta-D-heptose 1-phosphate adenosyltransferase
MTELEAILPHIRGKRVLVMGDIMVDEYIGGSVSRISPEAPVPVVEVETEELRLGGAANVAANVRSLGGNPALIGVVGDDAAAERLTDDLARDGIDGQGIIVDRGRPTTIKTRIIAGSQQIVRFDKEEREEVRGEHLARLSHSAEERLSEFDGLIISDYGKGVISGPFLQWLIPKALRLNKIISVDPKENHFPLYRGVTVITPNHNEAGVACGKAIKTEKDLNAAGQDLLSGIGVQGVLISRGAQGMRLFERGKPPVQIDTVAQEVYDVVGAGDTVVAALTLALAAGANLEQAARISNYAAGVVVGKKGTATVTLKELKNSLRANGRRS